MKLKKVRALLTALAFTVGTALCVSTVSWAKSLNPDPIIIINEQGEIVESAIQSDRTLYFGSKQPQDITKDVLERLRTDKAIKKDNLTAKDVSITLKSELVFDEEKNEFVESENDIKDVMTVKDDEITFSKTGFFLAEVSIKEDKLNVIFDIDDEVLAYADLNDWVVLNNTKSPDFSVKFDSKEIKSVKYDDSKVKVGTDGKYVLTYTITDAEDHVVKKDVLVTVGDKKVVNELSEKGVWVAKAKIIINNNGLQNNNSYKNPVVKPITQDNNKPNNSGNNGNQNPSVPSVPEKPEVPEHTHAWNDGIVTKEPTCTEAGEKTYTCTCGATKTEPIKALGHDLKETVITEPTCGAAGSKEITCSRCDYKEVTELPATGKHTYDDWVIVKEATCTEDGLRTQTCDVCDDVLEEVIKATGHTFGEWEVTTPATCETEGQEERTCESCKETETRVIKALGHEFVDYTYNNDATCEKDGTETAKCTRCDKTDTRVAEGTKLGHELKEEILTNPTCETAGSKKITCSRCDYEEIVEIPAIGHKWNDGEVTTAPTCTTEGVKTFTCQNDPSHTRTEVIPATGHDLKEEVIKPATCTEKGQVRVFCTKCDFEEIKETESFGHDMDEGVVTTQPTCTTDGVKTFTCKHGCGHTTTEVIKATGHKLQETVIKPATCTEKGEIKVTCANCDFEEIKYTDALGHNMVNGESTLPTCLTNGLTSKHCTRCDHHEDTVIPALGHHWIDVAEKGHWDTKLVWVAYHECRKCGFQTEDDDVILLHSLECGGTYTTKEKQVEKKTWVVDVPAHKECDRCHATH